MNVAETLVWVLNTSCGAGDIYPQRTDANIQRQQHFRVVEVRVSKMRLSTSIVGLMSHRIMGVPANLEALTSVIYREEAALSQLCPFILYSLV